MNVLKEGVKRNLCPTVNKETIVITVEDSDLYWSVLAMMGTKVAFLIGTINRGQKSLEQNHFL